MTTMAEAVKRYVQSAGGKVTSEQIKHAISSEYPNQWKPSTLQAHLYACAVNNPKAYVHHPYAEKFLFRNSDGTFELYTGLTHGPNRWAPSIGDAADAAKRSMPPRRASQMKNHPMPTVEHLRKAHDEFKRIEPRDFFYWSVSKLVASVLDTESRAGIVDELVRVLMMLLMTWNKNYYRFFETRKKGMALEDHFGELEAVITKHFECLIEFRSQRIQEIVEIPEQDIRQIFQDFTDVLGRVGAAKCLHLLAPRLLPLWDAAILKGYGLESGEHRGRSDAERYIEFIRISKAQIKSLGDFGTSNDNPLKCLDEYNYCRYTKKVPFD